MENTAFKNIAIIGDGAMGTVCGILLCEKNIPVRIWGYDRVQLEVFKAARENTLFLPGTKLPEALEFQPDDSKIFADVDLIVAAVPCQYIRPVFTRLKPYVPESVPVVSVAKGIENKTLLRPSQILQQVLYKDIKVAALSGPTIADELVRKLPATACAASDDPDLALAAQLTFNVQWLRVYTNNDIVGVELAGAMKNVVAIAAGIIDGIGAGDNAKAALLSRGLSEITRLGVALGADQRTFAGLTGLGDLVTTCISLSGRNRSLGQRIGKGQTVKDALAATRSVVEGVATCESVVALAAKLGIEMPITQAVYDVLFENKSVKDAIADLMTRKLKAE